MDILTQYYNSAGQIVSKSPDLSSREFYRDYVCRHRFNEMFCLGKTRSQVGWYQTYNGIFINCDAGQDSNATLYPGFTASPKLYNDGYTYKYSDCGEYNQVEGYNGGKAIKPIPYSWEGGYISTCLWTNKCQSMLSNKIRLRVIAKSPIVTEYNGLYPRCFIDFESDNFSINFGIESTGDTGYFFCATNGADGYDDFEMYGSNAYFILDGEWHIYDVVFEIGNPTSILVDGAVIGTGTKNNFIGNCLNPFLFAMLDTAPADYTVSLSSISLEKI